MALASTAASERPALTLPSNNPFRNRASSPSPASLNAPAPPRARPISTNPFLDNSDSTARPSTAGDGANNSRVNMAAAAIAADIFADLNSLDQPSPQGPPPPYRPGPSRPTEDRRERGRGPSGAPNSPGKGNARGSEPRRASASSVMDRERRPRDERDRTRDRDRSDRPPRTESEERRRRERRKEREERHRMEKEKGRKGKPPKKAQGLDLIDKLDVTGIYGQGLFHHDGPFDACNPHRNAKKDRRAPMQAFPEGSMNMALGGSGPVRNRLDVDAYHGRGVEGFSEFAGAAGSRKMGHGIVDPTQKIEQVHGEETYGLGTSTFLEGAPASRSALQRRESDGAAVDAGALSRTKSIAQRFRGMSGSRRNPSEVRSPNSQYGNTSDEVDNSPPAKIKATSAGGAARAKYNKENEINPFENDYEAAFDKKGARIRIAEQDRSSVSRTRDPANSRRTALVRSVTADNPGNSSGGGSGGGHGRSSSSGSSTNDKPGSSSFLDRMKSLKSGPRKPRVA